jgi:hypothetical protein
MGANAQTTVPSFSSGEVLTAANQNISAGTGVPVFATTVTRDAAFGGTGEKVLAEGQLCYLESTNVVQYYDGAAWATVGPTSSGLAVVQAQTTETAASTVTDDGVFTSTYRNYLLVGSFTTSSTGTVGVQLRASGSTTTTNYGYQRLTANDGTVSSARAHTQTSWVVANATNGAFPSGFAFYIYQPQIAASTPFWFQYNQQSGDNTGSLIWESRTGNQNSLTQFDGIIFTPSTGTITMTYTIYGFGTA